MSGHESDRKKQRERHRREVREQRVKRTMAEKIADRERPDDVDEWEPSRRVIQIGR